MGFAPHVTVAVPVKDRRERMLRCLRALLTLDYPRYDVLVLDNRSSDGTAEACRELADDAPVPVRVEVLDGSVGALRNRAARLTEGEIVAYTDSDCMPDPHWLIAGALPFADPRVGLVQGRTLPDPSAQRAAWDATIEVHGYSGHFESCNLLVRREALAESDGFDEQVGHFFEDTAAGWSLLRRGWLPAFAPDALVYHDVTYPPFSWWLRRGLRYGNVAAVVERYPELRKELLFARLFLRPRDAKLIAGLAGIALAPKRRVALVLSLPYLLERGSLDLPRTVLFDLSALVGLMRGSLRHRTLVL